MFHNLSDTCQDIRDIVVIYHMYVRILCIKPMVRAAWEYEKERHDGQRYHGTIDTEDEYG